MSADPRRRARLSGPLDLAFLAVLIAFALWASITTVLTDRPLVEARGYLTVAAVLAGGVLLGRLAAHGADARSSAVRSATVLLLPAGLCLLAVGILDSSLYANAQAATGVQIVALAALLLTSILGRGAHDRSLGALPSASVLPTASFVLTHLAAGLALALASQAQAGLMLVLVVAGISVLALARPEAVRRQVSAGITSAAIGAALAVVLALSSLPAWPRWLGDDQSLSFARQLLWRDALELWGTHPLLGGGPGSFYDSSPIARSEPHLYAAHSSVLQAGSELGTPAALLLLAVMVLGVLLAAQACRARALIGTAAWSALAVHSMIDHLYEFPIVVVLAGAVIGWAGARTLPSAPTTLPQGGPARAPEPPTGLDAPPGTSPGPEPRPGR